ncbi:serum opacity factor Sof [Streptococcus pyogenes]|uniref:serum opacification factor n=1 Tax=Streptococcus pyogenes TaxID=1314 RepID=UPI0010A11665|nr:serum opacification factor [Streptococcus pyogenes]VGU85728.1 serum opacity factor Sof [Streptococcus pyogenes]VGV25273.1 serum opacity factor Sof [Streptococcus pyogenes]VGW08727.1 serum opacity factor Sof [Streptococcus pyogenes]VHC74218.1 serum opacity factor Sof [Streptococcus pyogenes]
MTNCKYKLRKLSVGLVSVGTMLIAPTVLGQEVSNTEASASSTASVDATASGTTASGASSEATVATTNGGSQSTQVAAETTPQPQVQTSEQPAATSASSASSSNEEKSTKAAATSPSTPAASNNSNQVTGTEVETPMMEVEQYTVDKKETELKVKDGDKSKNGNSVTKDTKLIRNRDGEQRDIVDIKREVKTNADGTIDVTVTVTPKEIDKGADVMALLDVSKKMSEDDFNNAKDKIKKLVKTLTGENGGEHKARNSVRLMTFYREISNPIDISRKTDKELDELLDKLRQEAKDESDWGVDLQGAIHKARDIFKKDQEKKSGKRQHIVLFSQGESTFSYDIKNKSDKNLQKTRLTTVTTSNPLFSWFPIFDHTNRKADMLDDFDKLLSIAQKFGIKIPEGLKPGLKAAAAASSLFGSFTGGDSLTDYLTLREYMADKLQETDFDYSNRVGEGYHYHSFSERNIDDMPMKGTLESLLNSQIPHLDKKTWFGWALDKLSLTEKYRNGQKVALMKILDYLFYKREYVYYNHNLSAIAEAKMAQEEGITFYSVDVTDLKPKRAKRQTAVRRESAKKESEEDRNKKFDAYLKQMSEGGKEFFTDVDKADKFKDTLTELTIKDEFTDKVTVQESSEGKKYHKTSLISETPTVNHTAAATTTGWFSSTTKESLTWTISKEQLKKAFEEGKPLTLTYKLKVEKEKFKEAENHQKRKKRSKPTENENSVTEKIISNTITYKINQKKGNDKSLGDVNLTYSKLKVPVPQIDGQVIEPQAPTLPKLPPVIEHGPNFEYEEETGYQLPLKHGSNAPDTQVTIEEDTVPQRPDILVGGQSGPVDITEDTQPGMSGSNDATVIEEDTKPKRFFHFDNEPQAPEKPKEQPSLSLPQAPVYKAAHHLPASGDKREASFTIAALTIIGAAGLLSKKRRDTEEN